jgi:hypothetical protein
MLSTLSRWICGFPNQDQDQNLDIGPEPKQRIILRVELSNKIRSSEGERAERPFGPHVSIAPMERMDGDHDVPSDEVDHWLDDEVRGIRQGGDSLHDHPKDPSSYINIGGAPIMTGTCRNSGYKSELPIERVFPMEFSNKTNIKKMVPLSNMNMQSGLDGVKTPLNGPLKPGQGLSVYKKAIMDLYEFSRGSDEKGKLASKVILESLGEGCRFALADTEAGEDMNLFDVTRSIHACEILAGNSKTSNVHVHVNGTVITDQAGLIQFVTEAREHKKAIAWSYVCVGGHFMSAILEIGKAGKEDKLFYFDSVCETFNKQWICHKELSDLTQQAATKVQLPQLIFKGAALQKRWTDAGGDWHLDQNCGAINNDLFTFIKTAMKTSEGKMEVSAMLRDYVANYPVLGDGWTFRGPENFCGFSGLLNSGTDAEKKWAKHVIDMRANLLANMLAT